MKYKPLLSFVMCVLLIVSSICLITVNTGWTGVFSWVFLGVMVDAYVHNVSLMMEIAEDFD